MKIILSFILAGLALIDISFADKEQNASRSRGDVEAKFAKKEIFDFLSLEDVQPRSWRPTFPTPKRSRPVTFHLKEGNYSTQLPVPEEVNKKEGRFVRPAGYKQRLSNRASFSSPILLNGKISKNLRYRIRSSFNNYKENSSLPTDQTNNQSYSKHPIPPSPLPDTSINSTDDSKNKTTLIPEVWAIALDPNVNGEEEDSSFVETELVITSSELNDSSISDSVNTEVSLSYFLITTSTQSPPLLSTEPTKEDVKQHLLSADPTEEDVKQSLLSPEPTKEDVNQQILSTVSTEEDAKQSLLSTKQIEEDLKQTLLSTEQTEHVKQFLLSTEQTEWDAKQPHLTTEQIEEEVEQPLLLTEQTGDVKQHILTTEQTKEDIKKIPSNFTLSVDDIPREEPSFALDVFNSGVNISVTETPTPFAASSFEYSTNHSYVNVTDAISENPSLEEKTLHEVPSHYRTAPISLARVASLLGPEKTPQNSYSNLFGHQSGLFGLGELGNFGGGASNDKAISGLNFGLNNFGLNLDQLGVQQINSKGNQQQQNPLFGGLNLDYLRLFSNSDQSGSSPLDLSQTFPSFSGLENTKQGLTSTIGNFGLNTPRNSPFQAGSFSDYLGLGSFDFLQNQDASLKQLNPANILSSLAFPPQIASKNPENILPVTSNEGQLTKSSNEPVSANNQQEINKS